MDTSLFNTAINNIQDNFLYYDSVYGTKYNRFKSSIAVVSASVVGGFVGALYSHPITGFIAGIAVTSSALWGINKDKSQKPVTEREVKLVRDNLKITLEHKLKTVSILAKNIEKYEGQLSTTKLAVDIEKNANKRADEKKLIAETKNYEQNFDEKMQSLKMYLTGAKILNYTSEMNIKSTRHSTMLIEALKTFKKNKDGSLCAVETLLSNIPEQFVSHNTIIRHIFSDIGSRPVLKKTIGPIEQQYIDTQNMLDQYKVKHCNITNDIAAIRKVYTIDITNDKITLPNIEDFKQQMPN
jgi:hypothetical protein